MKYKKTQENQHVSQNDKKTGKPNFQQTNTKNISKHDLGKQKDKETT